MLFQYPDRVHFQASEDVQFHHHQVLPTFSKKDSEVGMSVSLMQILGKEKGTGSLGGEDANKVSEFR